MVFLAGVPEPAAALLFGLAAGLLAARRRPARGRLTHA
jgi:hypothetical protein